MEALNCNGLLLILFDTVAVVDDTVRKLDRVGQGCTLKAILRCLLHYYYHDLYVWIQKIVESLALKDFVV